LVAHFSADLLDLAAIPFLSTAPESPASAVAPLDA
jgi:hypothetical protein